MMRRKAGGYVRLPSRDFDDDNDNDDDKIRIVAMTSNSKARRADNDNDDDDRDRDRKRAPTTKQPPQRTDAAKSIAVEQAIEDARVDEATVGDNDEVESAPSETRVV